METKPLLYGLAGFFIGGFVVSLAAVTFDRPSVDHSRSSIANGNHAGMSTGHMGNLESKTGDDYDKAFLADMIAHHQDAVNMSKLSANNAKHDEIKRLSNDITEAQQKEIAQMKQWQVDWGYVSN